MNQEDLFVDDLDTALSDVVRALGGFKRVGAQLRPEKPPDEAGRWLADCFNKNRRYNLDPYHVMWLLKEGRRVGCHTAMHYLATEAGYVSPQPVEPEDEMAELQRQFMESVRLQSELVKRIERINPQVKRVA